MARAGSESTARSGFGFSGPVALILVESTHPQPLWRGPAAFAQNYHPLQTLPYLAGFALIGGFVALNASLHHLAMPAQRSRTLLALIATSVFVTLARGHHGRARLDRAAQADS